MPKKAESSSETFDVKINGEMIKVYFNTSKSSVGYYYFKFNSLWHWTRDENISKYNEFIV